MSAYQETLTAMGVYRECMLPYIDSDVRGCAETGVLLLFLSLTESRAGKLGLQIQPDDEIDTVAALLKLLPKTNRISKEEFADIVGRRFADLGSQADLGREFVLALSDASIAAGAQIYGRHPLEWSDGTESSLKRFCREALMAGAKGSFLRPVIPELMAALLDIVQQTGTPENDNLRLCVRWAGTGEIASAACKRGFDVSTFANNIISAGLASISMALESEKLQPGSVSVGDPDDVFDVVIASEQDFEHAARAQATQYGERYRTPDLSYNATAALKEGLGCVREEGGILIGLTSNRAAYGERTLETRRQLIEVGMDAVCELGRAVRMDTEHQMISVLRTGQNPKRPVLLAATASEAGRESGLDLTTRYNEEGFEDIDLGVVAQNIVRLIIDHQQIDYVSREFDREHILENEDASLRFSSYAEIVDVEGALTSSADWQELLEDAKTSKVDVRSQEKKFEQALAAVDAALS